MGGDVAGCAVCYLLSGVFCGRRVGEKGGDCFV